MAAASSLVSNPRNDRSGVNIHFVYEDELPLAHFVEHRVSEEEFTLTSLDPAMKNPMNRHLTRTRTRKWLQKHKTGQMR